MVPMMWVGDESNANKAVVAYQVMADGIEYATIAESQGKLGWYIQRLGQPDSQLYESPEEAFEELRKES
jgi:hypothetical protein